MHDLIIFKSLSGYRLINYSSSINSVFLKKVRDGTAPEYLIATLDSLRFEHKYSTRTKTICGLPKPSAEAMRRIFFYSTIKELKALNLERTTSFSLMRTTLTNNAALNYTMDKFKVKKLFLFLKIRAF